MEEPRWIESLKNAPLPPAGQLTDRALAMASSRPTRRAVFLAVLPLAAALPAVALLLPRPQKPTIIKLAVMAYTPPSPQASPTPQPTPNLPLPTIAESFPQIPQELSPRPLKRIATIRPTGTPASVTTPLPAIKVAQLSDLPQTDVLQSASPVERPLQERPVDLLRRAADPPTRKLSTMALAPDRLSELSAVAGLRYPLSPLPNVLQAPTEKASLYIHADFPQVYGDVTLLSETKPRELLVAVFDQDGVLTGTAKVLVPLIQAGVASSSPQSQTIKIPPFTALMRTSHYQLSLRAPFKRSEKGEQVVGGYRAVTSLERTNNGQQQKATILEQKGAILAPEGVQVGEPGLYQSSFYKDYFVRCQLSIKDIASSNFADRADLVVHGAVFDAHGTLLSVASTRVEYRSGVQSIDLAFGQLPEKPSGYRFKLAVVKEWVTR